MWDQGIRHTQPTDCLRRRRRRPPPPCSGRSLGLPHVAGLATENLQVLPATASSSNPPCRRHLYHFHREGRRMPLLRRDPRPRKSSTRALPSGQCIPDGRSGRLGGRIGSHHTGAGRAQSCLPPLSIKRYLIFI
jgi:hypothetical protein